MEKSMVVVDESRRSGVSVASAVKSVEFVAGINLTPVDLGCAMEEMDSPAHEHFSIRGFVAGMRKKDPKVCLPFTIEGDHDLPPLEIPKFRWWKCSRCIPETVEWTTPKSLLLTSKNDHDSRNSNIRADVEKANQQKDNTGLAKDSNLRADEAENVSSKCRSAEKSSNNQTHRDIPDLNEPYIEAPPNMQESTSGLLRLLEACTKIVSDNKRQMGAQEVPNYNVERCKTRVNKRMLDFPQTSGYKGKGKAVADMNEEGTRSARDDSAVKKKRSAKSVKFSNAYTQGQMPRRPSNFYVGGPSNQPSMEVCTLNRNPADFSYPCARNEFTISAEDLKPRKRKYHRKN